MDFVSSILILHVLFCWYKLTILIVNHGTPHLDILYVESFCQTRSNSFSTTASYSWFIFFFACNGCTTLLFFFCWPKLLMLNCICSTLWLFLLFLHLLSNRYLHYDGWEFVSLFSFMFVVILHKFWSSIVCSFSILLHFCFLYYSIASFVWFVRLFTSVFILGCSVFMVSFFALLLLYIRPRISGRNTSTFFSSCKLLLSP